MNTPSPAPAAPAPAGGGDVAIDLAIEDERWGDEASLMPLLRRAVDAALHGAGFAPMPQSELSVLLADDGAIRELNRDYRGFDKPTNVLSFPAGPTPPRTPLLGDLALAFETIGREAETDAKPFDHHLTHLVVHGVLHLLGYDHETDDEADAMETLETRILAGLGIADPYAPLDEDHTA